MRIISLGNQVDVNETEMLAALVADPHTQVITAYIEGVADGRAFMQTVAEASRRKPVVVLKGGQGEGSCLPHRGHGRQHRGLRGCISA